MKVFMKSHNLQMLFPNLFYQICPKPLDVHGAFQERETGKIKILSM